MKNSVYVFIDIYYVVFVFQGLLNVFKSKLAVASLAEPVTVCARFSYTLRDWTSFAWTQEPPDFEFLQGEIGVAELGTLPFGATFDPVR